MSMIIAITGHRPKYLNNEYSGGPITDYICVRLQEIIDKHKPDAMISGMALGVDTVWAKLALKNDTPLIAAIPFDGQEKRWSDLDQEIYHNILNDPLTREEVIGDIEKESASTLFKKRNQWLVDNCDMLVAVLINKNDKLYIHSGTAHAAKYAESQGVRVIYIDPLGGTVGEPCGE